MANHSVRFRRFAPFKSQLLRLLSALQPSHTMQLPPGSDTGFTSYPVNSWPGTNGPVMPGQPMGGAWRGQTCVPDYYPFCMCPRSPSVLSYLLGRRVVGGEPVVGPCRRSAHQRTPSQIPRPSSDTCRRRRSPMGPLHPHIALDPILACGNRFATPPPPVVTSVGSLS
jgi:hypothetical protein